MNEGMEIKLVQLNKHGTRSSTPRMDDWDFMEFSEISALLKNEKDEVGITQLFFESDSLTELMDSQNESGSCSSLTDESPISSPTSDQENIGVSEHWRQIPDGNGVELLSKNHSQLMYMSTERPLSSGQNIDETFISYSQDRIVWNPTSTATSSEAHLAGNFVQLTDVNHSRPNSKSFSSLSGKVTGETLALVRFSEASLVRKSTSVPASTEGDKAQSVFQTDANRLIQSSTIYPASSEAIMAKRHDGLPYVSQLLKQRHALFPTSRASIARNYAQLLPENQSMMQLSTPFFPSSKAKDQLPFGEQSCHTSNRAFRRPSEEKQVIPQNQTPYHDHTARSGKVFPVSKCGTVDEHIIKLPDVMDDFSGTNTKVEPQTSVKCRSRSKPGFSTNPRSLTEKTRRKRITERLHELQELVPKSVKGDNIVEMLDQAITYVGNLEKQLQVLLMRKDNQSGILSISISQGTDDMNETTN